MNQKTRWHGRNHYRAGMGEVHNAARGTEYSMADGLASPLNGWCPKKRNHLRRRSWTSNRWPTFGLLQLLLFTLLALTKSSTAAFVAFQNCLSPDIINSNAPKQLQFVPLFVWASFNSSSNSHNINVTVFGNVDGIATQQPYPALDDPQWKNPNETVGKIPDIAGPAGKQKYTTFTTQFNVLDYTPYNPPATRFCNSSALTECPLTPVFNFTGNE